MTEYILLTILIVHFIADFTCQTHEQAINKSTSNKHLFYHVFTYSVIWLYFCSITHEYIGFNTIDCLKFTGITFIAHFMTDYVTSRASSYFFQRKDFHNGFVVIGFDQILHYLQLYYTFKWLL